MAGILTHEQKQLAFRLRARGWRLVDIAREIGCTAPMAGLMVREGRFTIGVPDPWVDVAGMRNHLAHRYFVTTMTI